MKGRLYLSLMEITLASFAKNHSDKYTQIYTDSIDLSWLNNVLYKYKKP